MNRGGARRLLVPGRARIAARELPLLWRLVVRVRVDRLVRQLARRNEWGQLSDGPLAVATDADTDAGLYVLTAGVLVVGNAHPLTRQADERQMLQAELEFVAWHQLRVTQHPAAPGRCTVRVPDRGHAWRLDEAADTRRLLRGAPAAVC